MKKWISLSLSGGNSSRFHLSDHKALHKIAGKNIATFIIDAMQEAGIKNNAIVVPNNLAKKFEAALQKKIVCIKQNKALGTGDAVKISLKHLSNYKYTLIANGDLPLISSKLIKRLISKHEKSSDPLTIALISGEKYQGYGKVNFEKKFITQIDENKNYQSTDKLNAGIYAVTNKWLVKAINKIKKSSNGEFLLTDLIKIASDNKEQISSIDFGSTDDALQVNTDEQLIAVSKILRYRLFEKMAKRGVQITDWENTYIDYSLEIGSNSIILPNTRLEGKSKIGKNCTIGPNTTVTDALIGNNNIIENSTVAHSQINNRVSIGPYSHIRPKSLIMSEVNIGTNVEIKNSIIGEKSKINHFAYIGDAKLENAVNIGAGVVTANYDGKNKSITKIGQNAFIGSNATLIAPINLGDNTYIGAGSVVTKNVPKNQTWAGNPAKLLKK